ncbi:hypothetical protein MPTK1_5g21540 [Marchantia polymorpha subsp. ruderalis]|uniref:Uncharacterized protein n=2 Tax=Marchantia polymorpha TaxID=3197 RepID=A0AAF6BKS7_MARPO|nr:hypothetical protein MARPO_0106s0045 [Marchantia polymorpha]BBN12611.1 hypothetical protein Mp_5g21540 [Marchantia polymorpha subsp. ruderalis]|eukprot:PTQ31860.1 hypothetical protein MARPO_0106s0045 [Marchantia polymorpha]
MKVVCASTICQQRFGQIVFWPVGQVVAVAVCLVPHEYICTLPPMKKHCQAEMRLLHDLRDYFSSQVESGDVKEDFQVFPYSFLI